MSLRYKYLLTTIGLLPSAFAYPNRVPAGHAGAPGDTNPPCSNCHRVTLNPGGGKVEVTFPAGLVWQAGQKQQWTVRITEPDTSRRFGFQIATRASGTFTPASGTATASGYLYHTASQSTYTFEWTPPANGSGDIVVYVAALTGRGTSNSNVYTANYTLRAPAATPKLDSARPAVNGASFQGAIASGSWISLFGENLSAGGSRSWRADEITGGRLPLSLDGVSVQINNREAAIAYISPSQINAQAPEDGSTGAVSVQVITPAGTSDVATVTLAKYSPALFCFDPQSRRYAAALSATYEYIGPAALFGADLTTRPSRPSETVLLYGTGFGPTNPAVTAGSNFSGAVPLADLNALQVTVGGIPATVSFAGLTGPGLYQLNIVVPDLPDGDHLVKAVIQGVASQEGVYLALRR